ncbi:hypothetical protein WNZ14_09330 [Hoeflea sp. AS60]|uniref:hypothetical protein n=1 Tax=Hoeflea sp. AS60 TaxID=3135780 RepID=UPI0031724AFC
MISKPFAALSIAVGTGKIGYVFMVDGDLMDWGLSLAAAKSQDKAATKVAEWIKFYMPSVIVTERLTLHIRKSGQTLRNIEAIEKLVQDSGIHHVDVERVQFYANKYEEIQALTKRYPQITNWAPRKRRLWESEHPNTVLFEALSLVEEVK